MGAIFAIIALISSALLGSSMPFFSGSSRDPDTQASLEFLNGELACKPSVDKNRVIKVDVRNELDDIYKNNVAHPEFNKEEDEWVLVKQDAPIPAWKVALEGRYGGQRPGDIAAGNDIYFAEMEYVGTTIGLGGNPDNGKDAYIGVGWCDPATGTGSTHGNLGEVAGVDKWCLDPLVQDVMYVVTHQGVTSQEYFADTSGNVSCDSNLRHSWQGCHDWGTNTLDTPVHTQENIEEYWWRFNVYYKASKLPAEPSFEDLPCWMKLQCQDGSNDAWVGKRFDAFNTADCEISPSELAGNTTDQPQTIASRVSTGQVQGVFKAVNAGSEDTIRPRLIIKKSFMNGVPNEVDGITLAESYISSQKLGNGPLGSDEKIGTAYSNHFDVYIRKGNISGSSADHAIILDPIGYTGPWWLYIPILDDSKPQANSLQLGSFVPGIPSFFYEWWTPSCKPALYLYPEKEIQLTVKVMPNGHITKSIPEHGHNGWQVIAKPDGTIVAAASYAAENKARWDRAATTYPYLYYEASVKNVSVPKDTGWIKTSDQLGVFFADVLSKLGLNEKESKDFLEYWMPKLTKEGSKWYITLIDENEVNRVEPVEFSVQPDNFRRIRFYFENIDKKPLSVLQNLKPYNLQPTTHNRDGFTVIDWGGTMGNGSCGIEEISS